MLRHDRWIRLAVAGLAVASISSCGDGVSGPEEPDVPSYDVGVPTIDAALADGDLHTFMPAVTVVRESGRATTLTLSAADLDFSRFMEPFVLRVRSAEDGGRPVVGSVLLDGEGLLQPRDFAGADAFDLEIPLNPTSTIEVQLLGAPGGQVTLSIDAVIQPAPTIVITSPARSSMLKQGTLDGSGVEITGEACHTAYPITSLSVIGQAVPVAGDRLCESFAVTQQSRWGLSFVTVEVENARGRAARVVQSYLRSPQYLPVAFVPTDAARVDGGVAGQFNQPIFDDHDRSDLDDVASILQDELRATPLDDIVADRLFTGGGIPVTLTCLDETFLEYTVPSVTTGWDVKKSAAFTATPWVDHIRPSAGWLSVAGFLGWPQVPLDVAGYVGYDAGLPALYNCPLGGWLSASTSGVVRASGVAATATLQLASNRVSANDVVVTISDLAFDADASGLQAVLEVLDLVGLGNTLASIFADALEAAAEEMLRDVISGAVEQLLGSATLDETVTVNGKPLRVTTELGTTSLGGHVLNGFARFRLLTQVMPLDAPTGPPAARGAIHAGTTPPPFSASAYSLGVSTSGDLLNQLFWSAWQAGAFEASDLEALAGRSYPGLSGSGLNALLPPVSMPGGEGRLLDIGWGDVEVTTLADPAVFGLPGARDGEPVPVQAFASATVGIDLTFDEDAGRFGANVVAADVRVQLAAVPPLMDEAALTSALEQAAEDAILILGGEAVSAVPAPEFELGNASATTLRLDGVTVGREGMHLTLTGSVRN